MKNAGYRADKLNEIAEYIPPWFKPIGKIINAKAILVGIACYLYRTTEHITQLVRFS